MSNGTSLSKLANSAIEPEVFRQTLPNGVRLIIDRDLRFQAVSLGVMLIGGPADEDPERRGVTHLLEHMLFKRTKHWSAYDIASRNDDLGGTLNAYTDTESLVIHGTFPAALCASALEVMGKLIMEVDFCEEELSLEKEVVRQEILEAEDDPADAANEKFLQLFWPDSPLSYPITGTLETLSSIEISDLNRRLSEILVGKRVIVAVAGNVELSQIARWVENTFGSIPSGEDLKIGEVAVGCGFATLERSVNQVHVLFGCPWSKIGDEDFFPAMIVSTLLGEGTSSRLFQNLRENKGLCYEIRSDMESYRNAGLLSLYSIVEKSQLENLLLAIVSEVHSLLDTGLSDGELERAIRFNVARLLIETDGAEERLFRALYSEKELGYYRSGKEVIKRLSAVSRAEVEQLIYSRWKGVSWLLVLGGNTSNIRVPQSVLQLLAQSN